MFHGYYLVNARPQITSSTWTVNQIVSYGNSFVMQARIEFPIDIHGTAYNVYTKLFIYGALF